MFRFIHVYALLMFSSSSGMPLVSSLKVRLLALQVLGALVSGWEEKSSKAKVKAQKVQQIHFHALC